MKTLKYITITFLLVAIQTAASAQCVMCKAAAESSLEGGQSSLALGLNDGIFYLAAFPYIIVFTMIFLYKRRQNRLKMTNETA